MKPQLWPAYTHRYIVFVAPIIEVDCPPELWDQPKVYIEDPRTRKREQFWSTFRRESRKAEVGGFAAVGASTGHRFFIRKNDFLESYVPTRDDVPIIGVEIRQRIAKLFKPYLQSAAALAHMEAHALPDTDEK